MLSSSWPKVLVLFTFLYYLPCSGHAGRGSLFRFRSRAEELRLAHSHRTLHSRGYSFSFSRLVYVSPFAFQLQPQGCQCRFVRIIGAYSNFRADRDGGKWKLDAENTQRRRELFYELLTYDSWQVIRVSLFCCGWTNLALTLA